MAKKSSFTPIAVIGVGGIFPDSYTPDEFWKRIIASEDLMKDIPATHWLIDDYFDQDPNAPDKTYCKRGSFIPDVSFDPIEFGIPPNIMEATDTCQLLGLIVAKQVLMDAFGEDFKKMDFTNASTIIGTSTQQLLGSMTNRLQYPVWRKALRECGVSKELEDEICKKMSDSYVPWQESTFPGLLPNVVAGRISNRFNLKSTNCTVDAACAGALAAISMAIDELQLGRSDLCITGGADVLNDILMYQCFSVVRALSLSGDCRPFSAESDGTMLGEAVCFFALKRLSEAERDGNKIYAVIRGIGSSSDGRSKSIYAPVSEGQALAVKRCYDSAGYEFKTIGLLEAHGTATIAGDLAEFNGLKLAYGDATQGEKIALGSVKSQVGHTKSAAAATSLFKTIMALHHKVLPSTIKIKEPNPKLNIDASPFYLNTETRPWIHVGAAPRRASVSSFGFGGTNFHITLEEYLGDKKHKPLRYRSSATELLLYSATSVDALKNNLKKDLATSTKRSEFLNKVKAQQKNFNPNHASKLAFIASEADFQTQLKSALQLIDANPKETLNISASIFYSNNQPIHKLAFLFSDVGNETLYMGRDEAINFEDCFNVWQTYASMETSRPRLDEIVFPYPVFTKAAQQKLNDQLKEKKYAQPALTISSLATLALLKKYNLKAFCAAGVGAGELIALYAADVIAEQDLLSITKKNFTQATLKKLKYQSASFPVYTSEKTGSFSGKEYIKKFDQQIEAMYASGVTIFLEIGAGEQLTKSVKQILKDKLHVAISLNDNNFSNSFWRGLGILSVCGIAIQFDDAWHAFESIPEETAAKKTLNMMINGANYNKPYPSREVVKVIAPKETATVVPMNLQKQTMQRAPSLFVDGGASAITSPPITIETAQIGAGNIALARNIQEDIVPTPNAAIETLQPLLLKIVAEKTGYPADSLQMNMDLEADLGIDSIKRVEILSAMQEEVAGLPELDPAEMSVLRTMGEIADYVGKKLGASLPTEIKTATISPFKEIKPAMMQTKNPVLDTLQPLLLKIVAEKTGYPADSLQMNMDLEADLGIDSIKRVEILSAMQEEVPGLPELDPAEMSVLRTMGEIADYVGKKLGGSSIEATQEEVTVTKNSAIENLQPLLLKIVAEKTGYPADSLQMNMDLEADLGIDSIKRVEILSAMQEEVAGLPELDPAEMSVLRTMGEIADYVGEKLGAVKKNPSEKSSSTNVLNQLEEKKLVTDLDRHEFKLSEMAPQNIALSLMHVGKIQIIKDRIGIAEHLEKKLRAINCQVQLVNECTDAATVLIDLRGLNPINTISDAIKINKDAFLSAKKIAATFSKSPGAYVVLQSLDGYFGTTNLTTERAWTGGLSALAKTAAREWQNVIVKSIDIGTHGKSSEELATIILNELRTGGDTPIEIGLPADGKRLVVNRMQSFSSQPPITCPQIILATGGARGITAACLLELAKEYHPKIALIGRTHLIDESGDVQQATDEAALKKVLVKQHQSAGKTPNLREINDAVKNILNVRDIKKNIAALKSAGSEVLYFAVDILNADQVKQVMQTVHKTWGPITGVIHGAGVLADKLIADKTEQQFDHVFDTKVEGLQVLLAATAQEPLQSICLFSSVSASFGNVGQCDYAMANEILNKVANQELLKRKNCVVKSINWGPWESGMVTPALKDLFAKQGIQLIPIESGAKLFVHEMLQLGFPAEVVIGKGFPAENHKKKINDELVQIFTVHPNTHAYLFDHQVKDSIVIPLCLILDWFCQTGSHVLKNPSSYFFKDIRVLKGIRLANFTDAHSFVVTMKPFTNELYTLELSSADLKIKYCSAKLSEQEIPAETIASKKTATTNSWPWSEKEIYQPNLLFHGKTLHVIKKLEGVSEKGGKARLSALQKNESQSILNVPLLDGSLQLACLWARFMLKKATLPMSIESLLYMRTAVNNEIICEFQSEISSQLKCKYDMQLYHPDGTLFAKLSQLEMLTYDE